MVYYPTNIEYSDKYFDLVYEYKNVILPKSYLKKIPGRLMNEKEWRELGIVQSRGWEHYLIFKKEPHVILFRRPIGTDPETGNIPNDVQERVKEFEINRSKIV